MPTVVVLGANAFSGRDFADLLVSETEYRVMAVSRSQKGELFRPKRGSHIGFGCVDLNRDMGELLAVLDEYRPEYVVNFAAQSEVAPSWESPEDWFQTNCVALARLVNHLRRQSYLKKFVQISSPEIYGDVGGAGGGVREEEAEFNPSTPYAASKAAADMLLNVYRRQYGFPVVTVRSTNTMGPRQQLFKLIPRTIIAIKQGRKVQLHGGGMAVKSYIHVRDVSRGTLAVMERGKVGDVYHLSPDRGITVRHAVHLIAELMGKALFDVAEDAPERPGQDAAYVIDSSKARTELGWSPSICFRDGVADTIKWVEENWKEISKAQLEYVHRA